MKSNLIKLALAGFLTISFFVLPVVALGLEPPATPTPPSEAYRGRLELQELIGTIGNWLFWIILSLAVIFILLAAFTFLTSGGDPEKVNKAKGQLIYALVAVVVAVLAYGLVELVRAIVAGGAVSDPGNGTETNNDHPLPPGDPAGW